MQYSNKTKQNKTQQNGGRSCILPLLSSVRNEATLQVGSLVYPTTTGTASCRLVYRINVAHSRSKAAVQSDTIAVR